MKVILKKDVANIGKRHDIKDVSNGHALNFLIPNNLAIVATDAQIKKIELIKAEEEAKRKINENLLAKNLKEIGAIKIAIAEKTNDKGHLFSGIHKEKIAEEIKKQTGLDISPEFMDLAKPLKEVGDHKITVSVSGKTAQFIVSVSAL
jgi:large subunit ribosomal protein L9